MKELEWKLIWKIPNLDNQLKVARGSRADDIKSHIETGLLDFRPRQISLSLSLCGSIMMFPQHGGMSVAMVTGRMETERTWGDSGGKHIYTPER